MSRKHPIAIAIFIVVIGGVFGLHGHHRLADMRETHGRLVEEAARLGISIDYSIPSEPIRITKRGERDDKDAQTRWAVRQFMDFAVELEAMEQNEVQPDAAMQERILKFMDLMISLDASQIQLLIAEVRANKDLKDETREGLIAFTVATLAGEHPQIALEIFSETSHLPGLSEIGGQVISTALSRWAKFEPMAALAWVRENGGKHADLVTSDAKRGMVAGAAHCDPGLAFKLIDELGFDDKAQAVADIMATAGTAGERTAVLSALRDYVATLPDDSTRAEVSATAAGVLVHGMVSDGFEAATRWIEDNHLNAAEREQLAMGLPHREGSLETGRWIEWTGANLSGDARDVAIGNLVAAWVRKDFQATAAWLDAAPDGPVRDAAIRSFAVMVSPYEPEVATQWANTLPPGVNRDLTLRRIEENRPQPVALEPEPEAIIAAEPAID